MNREKVEVWECATCGRDNPARLERCLQCGRTQFPNVPEEGPARSGAAILAIGSLLLSEKYGVPVRVRVYGGEERLSPEEARRLLAETEQFLTSRDSEGEGDVTAD